MHPEQALKSYTVNEENGCWLWNLSVGGPGYPQANINGKMMTMHRFFYEHHVDYIPPKMLVCHTCDTKRCVNPDHLYVGTHADNSADAIERGRHRHGESVGTAKLSNEDVLAIRSSELPPKEIAQLYPVSIWAIYDIRRGRRWKHLPTTTHKETST